MHGLSKPVRGVVHGGPDFLPTKYMGVGTPGFTDAVFRGSWVAADFSLAAVEIAPEMMEYAGHVMMIDGVEVTFPSESDGVDELPPELLEENGAFWWIGGESQEPEEPPPEEPPPEEPPPEEPPPEEEPPPPPEEEPPTEEPPPEEPSP